MSSYYIDYNFVADIAGNDKRFSANYASAMLHLHKLQESQEKAVGYSYEQYRVLLHYIALDYCVNLFMLSLKNLENETLDSAIRKQKKKYNYKNVQKHLAHFVIDLDDILSDVVMNYEPVVFETEE